MVGWGIPFVFYTGITGLLLIIFFFIYKSNTSKYIGIIPYLGLVYVLIFSVFGIGF
jgi:hypothetical protein